MLRRLLALGGRRATRDGTVWTVRRVLPVSAALLALTALLGLPASVVPLGNAALTAHRVSLASAVRPVLTALQASGALQGQMAHLAPRATLALPEGMASTALPAPRGRTAHRVATGLTASLAGMVSTGRTALQGVMASTGSRVATGLTAIPARRATRVTPALASPLAARPDRSPSRHRPLTTTSHGRTPHPAAVGGHVRRRRSSRDPSRQERPPQGRSNWLAPTVRCE